MVNYKEVLENLGYQLTDRGNFWQTSAVFRNGDNKTAILIYKNSGVWKDFVEDTQYLPFEALVEKTIGTSDKILLKQIKEGKGEQFAVKKPKLLMEEKTYDPSCLNKLLPHYDFYILPPKNISRQTLMDYKCGLATSGKMYQRLVFPIFRQDGKIHGFSGRLVVSKDAAKWLHRGKKNNWFYPYYTCQRTQMKIKKERSVYLVESIGDSLALYDASIENNLVVFGIGLSPILASRISGLDVDKIFISLNNDEDSDKNRGLLKSAQFVCKLSQQIDFKKIYLCSPIKNDFGEMSKEEISLWHKHSKNLTHQDSCKKVIDILGFEIKSNPKNKNLIPLLGSFIKKYKFFYE